jgi:outer membrane receptor protein involved in Fe transport
LRPVAALAILATLAASPAVALEEVIVTARRSATTLLDYPGSATRIAASALELSGATHSSELLNRAAGAMIQRGSGQESLTALRSPVLTGAGAGGARGVGGVGHALRPGGRGNLK